MILLIKTNKDALHDDEFVKPIQNILHNNNIAYQLIDINQTNQIQHIIEQLAPVSGIIIAGTALQDFDYLQYDISAVFASSIPHLGICAGVQLCSPHTLDDNTVIAMLTIDQPCTHLLFTDVQQVYCLHTKMPRLSEEWQVIATHQKTPLAYKHKDKHQYLLTFHPEVRNKVIIERFLQQCNN